MRERPITIKLHKKQIADDVTVECNMIGAQLQQSKETQESGARIMTPDDDEIKPIVARAMTEGFGEVKRQCQKYLVTGRENDDNRREKINEMSTTTDTLKASSSGTQSTLNLVAGTTYTIRVSSSAQVKLMNGSTEVATVNGMKEFEYTPSAAATLTVVGDATTDVTIKYMWGDFGYYELRLALPESFNVGVTETLKSYAHRTIVDYVMSSVLFNQYPDRAKQYGDKVQEDMGKLADVLNSRVTNFTRRSADWT
jgi:hypothetical protein